MAIIIEAAGSELSSPFFVHNNKFAKAYTEFAEEHLGEISGTVNSYLFDAMVTVPNKIGNIKITAKSQTKNVQSGFAINTSPKHSTSIFEIAHPSHTAKTWRIRPKSFRTNCVSLMKEVSPLRNRPELVFISSEISPESVLPATETLIKKLQPFGFLKLTQNSRSLEITFGRLSNTQDELSYITNELVEFCGEVKTRDTKR